jgi:hypothetical protein
MRGFAFVTATSAAAIEATPRLLAFDLAAVSMLGTLESVRLHHVLNQPFVVSLVGAAPSVISLQKSLRTMVRASTVSVVLEAFVVIHLRDPSSHHRNGGMSIAPPPPKIAAIRYAIARITKAISRHLSAISGSGQPICANSQMIM